MADESKERRATEDLLAGFDRPGRTPRAPPVKRDFVDFHAGNANPAEQRGGDTVLLTRARRPNLVPWIAVAFVSAAVFGIVAGLSRMKPAAVRAEPTMSVAPVVTAPPVVVLAPSAAPVVAASSQAAPARPPPPPKAAPAPAAASAEEPRVDFVRNL